MNMQSSGDFFVDAAQKVKRECSKDRDRPDIREALKRIDKSLDVVWNNANKTFSVVVGVQFGAGTSENGHPIPIFDIGANPNLDHVLAELRRRDLRGRTRQRAQELNEDARKADSDHMNKVRSRFLPGMGEYMARLTECDDWMTARNLAKEMRKEVDRNDPD